MASLLSLSAELKLNIIEQLNFSSRDLTSTYTVPTPSRDLLNLGRVSSVFRALTAPFVFRDITLLNDEKIGSSVSAILDSTQARHVRSLHYVGIKAMPDDPEAREDPVEKPSPKDFPESVYKVLSSLSRFQNLDRLTVRFACDKEEEEDVSIYLNSYYTFEEPEDLEKVLEAEGLEAYRSLMMQTYRALARNTKTTVKHLELRNVVAKECSAWRLDGFRALLEGLVSFRINLRGGDNGAGWKINKTEGYLDFVSQLDTYFFRHLTNVKYFSFAATHDGPPGIRRDMNNAVLPLLEEHMPQLQSLSLRFVFISGNLADFITAHGDTLEKIVFTECYSQWPAEEAITWGDFFFSIAAKSMKALLDFDIERTDLEYLMPVEETDWRYHEMARVKLLRDRFPGRRMFDYKHIDDKYGMVFDSRDKAFERFQEGSDHRGWSQVCKIIDQNYCVCGECGR
ncbi:hypothetical protein N0V86_002836 [Didymella sp. IMI 355093]|nr:hypothetical protein N0V86_002836 [Didymella sp. IMI 355093]